MIDGGSTDDTLDILQSYGDRISWVSEKDDGQAQAINKGIRKLSVDIMAFINSDDVYLPGTLASVGDYFTSHTDAMWLTGDHFIIDECGKRMQSYVSTYKKILRSHPTFADSRWQTT